MSQKISIKDLKKLSFFFKKERYGKEIKIFEKFIKEKKLFDDCLYLLYILNNNRDFDGAGIAIYEIAMFLNSNYGCFFDIRYDYDKKCPYKDGNCDMLCNGAQYANCNMDAPAEYLSQSK